MIGKKGDRRRVSGAAKDREPTRIQSLSRANAILDVIAAQDAVSLTEIARRTLLNTTTVYYLVETLVSLGFVERTSASGGYRLGLRNLELGWAVQQRFDIVATARPALMRLCAATKETANLCVPYLFEAMIVESVEGIYGVRATAYAGTRAAYHSTSGGKAILAHLDDEVRQTIYRVRPLRALTTSTITDIPVLEEQLKQVRREGVAYDFEENEEAAHCVAAPIFDGLGEIAGAISISGPMNRLTTETAMRLGEVIAVETEAITAALSGTSTGSGLAGTWRGRQNGAPPSPITSPTR
ncbi:MAG: IclR family transcriptional regulator [bacterium]|nr:IclR family transcriptional regulator [bacterium]